MEAQAYADLLDAYVRWATEEPDVLGLAAVGSTSSTGRSPDPWSDHDLLVVVRAGSGGRLRSDLSWLPDRADVVLAHHETRHGFALIRRDGHLVELAIFEPDELEGVVLEDLAVLVDKEGVGRIIEGQQAITRLTVPRADDLAERAWAGLVKELVIGIGRARRGELLSAHERIKGSAVRHVLHLAQAAVDDYPAAQACSADPHRRAEVVAPDVARDVLAATALDQLACAAALLDIGGRQAERAGVAGADAAAAAVRRLLVGSRSGGH